MDCCYWLLTNTCYGTWLPGDERGFVGQVREHRTEDPRRKRRNTHDLPGTRYDGDMPGLMVACRRIMRGPPIHLTIEQAEVVVAQFQQTACIRHWELLAAAIMFNHFHVVIGASDDVDPAKILGDLKSWGTRRLSERFGVPRSKTWWTERGSKRKLSRQQAIDSTVDYLLFRQPSPLITWSPGTGSVRGIPSGVFRKDVSI